jgi:hypothetical protein
MTTRCRGGASWSATSILAFLAFACSSDPTPDRDNGAADGSAKQVHCPTGPVSEVPTGRCDGVGTCEVELVAVCTDAGGYIPDGPIIYACQCSGHWSCTIIGGPLGLIACDAGAADDTGAGSLPPP